MAVPLMKILFIINMGLALLLSIIALGVNPASRINVSVIYAVTTIMAVPLMKILFIINMGLALLLSIIALGVNPASRINVR
ncbi:hypothetical protein AHF37_08428 [Paragonimus kellicotti]|nr:hypothetical protein AHF37_08428 [Paragonimus kellicotti]